ncbi:HsdR family type I site-specific deoxyribonuclease [Geminicoccaceae bacterium 1502E]|nr:HsdR family type I site-specific deoxyribonuclease [Geminicoccaceae bacterium 1502E]
MSEYAHVERPLLTQLESLGWTVLDQGQGVPADPAASLRESFAQVFLPGVFREAARALNLTADGREWLTERQLAGLLDDIFRRPARSLLEANEAVQKLLLKAQVDHNELTGEADPTVRLIDFDNPERNRFHAINQFRVHTPGRVRPFIIPDIVLFVNGLPLVVIEAKTGSATAADPMHEAFTQLARYRDAREETRAAGLREGEPRLFYPNLLLVRSCGESADAGTISSGPEHYYAWKSIWPERYSTIEAPLGVVRAQEQLVQGLLNPHALLDLLRSCSVFMDLPNGKRVKIVARYQQHRAARRIVARLRSGATPADRSGVVWHTQGSGKSLTMVFVGRMLRASSDLNDIKLVLVVDRADLEDQLTRTAKLIGGRVNVVESREQVRSALSTPASDVNMVMTHKFLETRESLYDGLAEALGRYEPPPGAETFGTVNPSERILLMIDEAHRTQGAAMGDNLFEAFPNAARIAFTGTPLITGRHQGRRTVKRFGEYIDTYRIMDSVADGTTVQILYEGRTAHAGLRNPGTFDAEFEDLFADRSEAELLAIKKKYGATGDILEAESRIGAIARDIVAHYVDQILPNGFKAQVVCHSKRAAIRYQKALREALAERLAREHAAAERDEALIELIAFLKVAVIVSSDGANEEAAITAARREAQRWNAVTNFCRPFEPGDHEKEATGIAFLVVCDMLLTGFDAPVEQVMYIDKRLKEHTLLQAIARVNRVASGKQRGYVVDYIGLANHLAEALSIYAAADPEDLAEGLKSVGSELPILEERYRRLIQHFQEVKVDAIEAFVHGDLGPADEVRTIHAAVDALERVKPRADFEVYLKKFLQSLDLVLPGADARPFRGPAKRFGYLLRMAKERYKDETLDLSGVGGKVTALINRHLVDLGIDPTIPPVELLDPGFLDRVAAHAQGEDRARASEMEHAIRKHCTVRFEENPAYYKRMSEKLDALIRRHGEDWETLAEQFAELREELSRAAGPQPDPRTREHAVFRDNLADLAGGGPFTEEDARRVDETAGRVLDLVRVAIRIAGFWRKPEEIRRMRAGIKTELMTCGIAQVEDRSERIAIELTKLAENRHAELVRT